MEILVDFTNRETACFEQDFVCEKSIMGNVYFPKEGIEITGEIQVNYMRYPWMSCFEVEGIVPGQL